MSLQELPQSILFEIVQFISDPEVLCSLDASCKDLHQVIRRDTVWEPLVKQRWIRGNHFSRRHHNHYQQQQQQQSSAAATTTATTATTASAREEYKRRHVLDMDMTKCVSRLSRTTEQLPMLYAFSHAMARGADAMDICHTLWRHHKNPETQGFARGLLGMLHCGTVCAEMVRVLRNNNDSDDEEEDNDEEDDDNGDPEDSEDRHDQSLTINADEPERSPGERLEAACILTTCMFQEIDKEGLLLEDTTAKTIQEKLQSIANTIKNGFTNQMSLKGKLERVDDFFFRNSETRFTGNETDYYDYRNSLLDVALERRKAIPMTLAILYKFICQRLDILVEIVGLPGHIVAHVPEMDRFVDVFAGGRHLTAADCANIVTSFGFPMQQSYLNPLPVELVVQRILNNLENCLIRHPAIQTPQAARQRAAITALRAIASNPRSDQLLECRHLLVLTWVSEACVGTDISDW